MQHDGGGGDRACQPDDDFEETYTMTRTRADLPLAPPMCFAVPPPGHGQRTSQSDRCWTDRNG